MNWGAFRSRLPEERPPIDQHGIADHLLGEKPFLMRLLLSIRNLT